VAQSLILTRLEGGRTPMPPRESVRAFARHGTTMALYLSAARNRALQEELLAGGYPPDTPVIIGHRVSWPDEVLLRCRLDELSATMKDHRFFRHTVILVGPALADADPEHRSHLYHPGFRHGYRAADPDAARALRESGAVVGVPTSSTGGEGPVSTSSTDVGVSTSSTDVGSITVFGYAGRPGADLRAAAASATLVVGGRRHLDALGVPDERRLELGPVAPAVDALAALPPDADAVVVASGDPLFYGVVRRLRQAGLRVRVVPTVTSLQLAFAAVAVPWDDALLVSLHGNDPAPGLAACRTHPKVGVLTDPATGFAEVVRATAGLGRTYVLAEHLGEDDARVRVLSEAEALIVTDVAQPHVVLVLAHHPDDPDALGVQHPIAGGVRPDPEVLA